MYIGVVDTGKISCRKSMNFFPPTSQLQSINIELHFSADINYKLWEIGKGKDEWRKKALRERIKYESPIVLGRIYLKLFSPSAPPPSRRKLNHV